MFEAAELGRTILKDEYKARAPALRTQLLEAQRDLTSARFPVIVVFAGVDGAGKGEIVNLLNEWMDPRWIVTRAYGEPSDEERERPEYLALLAGPPAKGPNRAVPELVVLAPGAGSCVSPNATRRF